MGTFFTRYSGSGAGAGPFLLLIARSLLLLAGQSCTAGVFAILGDPAPWKRSTAWWTVFGSVADLGCLLLLAHFFRREGVSWREAIGFDRARLGRDLLGGLGYFAIVFPVFLAGSVAAALLVWGTPHPQVSAELMGARRLPWWAIVYSLTVWWPIWSATEETTYQAYVLPRLEKMLGSRAAAVGLTVFFFSLQHSFLPLLLEPGYVMWRFLGFVPGCLLLIWARFHAGRLMPVICAHWPMDLLAAAFTIRYR